jgi:hypothetical protein
MGSARSGELSAGSVPRGAWRVIFREHSYCGGPMKKILLAMLLAASGLFAACGDDDDDDDQPPSVGTLVQQMCSKAESCAVLGEYDDVQACVVDKNACLSAETEASRNTWRTEMNRCNQIEGCDAWFACWLATPTDC